MAHNEEKHDSNHGHHPLIPLRVYFLTLGALLVLTVVTVGASYIDVGSTANVLLSLGIASTKAALVLMFFMGLKFDNNLNRAYILSSFVALIILMVITASDMWTRPKPRPVVVRSTAAALSQSEFDALLASSAEQVARGQKVYDVNCAVCHGTGGNGDGAGGAALNPKPRNFHSPASEWKNGTSTKAMYVTLAYGIPGSGMASYQALPPVDRIALIHYVHSMMKDVQATSAGDARFAEAVKADGIGGSGSGAAKTALPIDFAIDRIVN